MAEDTEYDIEDQNIPAGLRARVKQLEKENKELRSFETENKSLKQKDALREAGLDLTGKKLTAFLAAHGEGESTPEALKATAIELGYAEPEPDHDKADEDAHKQISDTTTGTRQQGQQASYEDEIASARNSEEVIAISQKHGRPVA